MRVVVIGGTGHIGSFLLPRLVRAGHEVVSISRGQQAGYVDDDASAQVQHVTVDRVQEDQAGSFPTRVAKLQADAVIDLVCFTLESATGLVEGLRGHTGHLVHCGSIWRHGPSLRLPVTEKNGAPPVGEYGIAKAAIAAMLKQESSSGGLVTTSLHPGHIVGPGWHPIGPLGNVDPTVWQRLSAGQPVETPGIGAETMHHVHADDVAQAFEAAVGHRDAAAGEDFDVVAPSALNVRGYLQTAASWFGQRVELSSVTWEAFRAGTAQEHADCSWEHLMRSHCLSIDKARTVLGYTPRYEPDEAVLESVRWLIDHQQLEVANPLTV
ncbi:epimerase [Humibacillus sp. DSM 29435]|uniref:NAD-dependent epimerase/dehydratase family protein n=1 Tax=Humibacillus sp. DSM 29435 TaxID=1869167 RepID=UPI000872B460|nr:NAD(P)-dependent oxidoreductase [Humibacillus sp. DSM 29435]OFE18723.1 epimerase [Humibacillus sp. DSM 29435]